MSHHAQLSHDLYRYLTQHQLLPNTQKYKPSGNFELEPRLQEELQSGYLIARLLTILATEKGVGLNGPLMSSIKNSNTPAVRVYNWNILAQGFGKIGVVLAKERQKEIISGNFDALVLFLLDVQNKGNQKKIEKNGSTPVIEQGLDIKKVHKYEQLAQSETVLEFIIILLSKTLNLTAKQAVATLAQSAKYLAHIVVKGVKNSFDEILAFIEESRTNMDKIMYLVEKDAQKNLQFLLQLYKPTLISREPDVAKAGTQVLKALVYESFKYNSKNIVYQILCKEGEGFDFLYMGLKRHPYLNFQIFNFLYPLLQGTLKDFLQIPLKRTISNQQQYLRTVLLLLQPLLQHKEAKQQLFTSGLLALWQKNLDHSTTSSKLKGKDPIAGNEETRGLWVEVLYTMWMGYYRELEPGYAEELLMKVTEELKKNTRSENYTIRIPSLLKLFNLLQFLATNRNKLAALLYKKIIFLYVENHSEQEMRQIVLQNLTLTIHKFPTIPLQFLLEPMLKQLTSKEGTTYILNMYDFQFIIELCKHPKMEEYYAITFLDYFVKLYTKSVIYSSLIFRVIQAITARFCQSEQIREYCLRSTEVCLGHYGMLVMGKSKNNKAHYSVQKNQNKQQQILTNQKKSLTIELIKHYISLQHKELTLQIKQKVASLFIEWYENRNHYDKGLAAILMQIGDIEEILVEYKQRQMEIKAQQEENRVESSNQFFSKGGDSGRDRNTEKREDSNLEKYMKEDDSRGTPTPQEIGLGYKKKKIDISNKYEVLASRSKNIKPDPKVLQDIQKIKQKWRLDQSRAKLQEQQAKKDRIGKINEVQLFQRNLSLGYSKLPDLNNDQILFDFESVKKRHLKDSLDLIIIQNQQQRELKSFLNVIQRYQKYIKSLFINYASKSGPMSDNKQLNILSFTQIMRMLKDKNLIAKIPKIAINEIITTINQKRKKERNVLGGVYEQDFPTFILYYTDLFIQQDRENKKDEPYGLKVEKVLLKMLEGEKNVKELFDPKIQKLKEELEFNENLEIPQDFKKVKETQVQLDYTMRQESGVRRSFIDCYEIVDGLVYEAVGVHIVSPITDFKEKVNLLRIFKAPEKKSSQSVDKKLERSGTESAQNSNVILNKDILTDSHNSFTKPLKKLSKNLIKKKSQSQRAVGGQQLAKQSQQAERDKKRQLHAQKLKEQIIKMRQEKQKIETEKKQKDKQEEEKKKKRQEIRQQYLEQNKKKLKQKKQQDDRKAEQQKRLQNQNKQKRKAEVKSKQAQMLEKQRKLIQAKREKLMQKAKQVEFKQKAKDKFVKSKSNEKLLNQMKVSAADQKMRDLLIKNSMQNGEIKNLVDKNKKNFQDLFQIYWNWQKQKIELKGLAQMLKDLDTTKYIHPKQIADVYKSVAKGQLLGLPGFIESLVKLSYKSTQIEQETKKIGQENGQKDEIKENENRIRLEPFEFMLRLLKMQEPNYKQAIMRIKHEKQSK